MATKKTDSILNVEIPAIEKENLIIKVVGDSPLIVHKWTEKAKKEMLDKHTKRASKGKETKDPWMDYCNSMYWLDEMPERPTPEDIESARFGFPARAFKACAIDAGYQQGALAKKTTARGAFHVTDEFVEIIGTPNIREDMVQIGQGKPDIRYRGEFREWEALINIVYNPMAMSAEQIINLFNLGGFANGVGEWRPSKDGSFGTFHVESADE